MKWDLKKMITRRVYVDSRNAVSGDSRNFLFELPEDITLPKDACCYITDLSLPHAFYTIDENNKHIYVIEQGPHARKIELTSQHYDVLTLEAELQTRFNQAQDAPGWPGNQTGSTYTVTYNPEKNNYTIALGAGTFQFLTDAYLKTYDGGSDWNAGSGPDLPVHLASLNDTLGLRGSYAQANSHDTGHTDIRNYHTLFLHSSSLGSYNTIGPLGVKSVLVRIPVTVDYGDIVRQHHSGLVHDYIDCGGQTLRTLQFSLRDGWNREVDIQGGNLSFTLLFTEKPVI